MLGSVCITSGQLGPKSPASRNGGFFVFKNENDAMSFFTSAVSTLQTLIVALGVGLAVWGVINLLGTGRISRAQMRSAYKEATRKFYLSVTLRVAN